MLEILERDTLNPGIIWAETGFEQHAPLPIEGTFPRRSLLARSANTAFTFSGLPALRELGIGTGLSIDDYPRVNRIVLGASILIVIIALTLAGRLLSCRMAMAVCATVLIYADYFVPLRYGYGDVVYLLPLALLLRPLRRRRVPLLAMVLIANGVFLYTSWAENMLGYEMLTKLRSLFLLAGITIAMGTIVARTIARRVRSFAGRSTRPLAPVKIAAEEAWRSD